MDYSKIPDTLSQEIRDAALDERRVIFDDPQQLPFIFDDPQQCWHGPRWHIRDEQLADILLSRENPNSF